MTSLTLANVLITGASGFIGYHLVPQLVERGDRVTVLVRRTSNLERLANFHLVRSEGDLSDLDSLRRAVADQDVVYHLAGLVKARRFADLLRVNEQGTANLVQACGETNNPPTLVHVSSLAAAGPAVQGRARIESDEAAPVSMYGRSKLASERAARRFAGEVPITIIRPPIVFGQADRAFLQIVKPISRTRVHTIPGISPKYFSLIHAADLSMMMIAAGEKGERIGNSVDANSGTGIYFAEAERQVRYGELGTLIGHALRKRTLRLPFPHAAVWLIAGMNQLALVPFGSVPALNIDKAREATAGSWICDDEKAHQQLGYQPALPLTDRLQETVDWYAEQRWL